MSNFKTSDLTTWKEHPEDFIVVCNSKRTSSGEHETSYLIVHVVNPNFLVPRRIDDPILSRDMALEMLNNGVKAISMNEFQELLAKRDKS